jgi:hypothetical protein
METRNDLRNAANYLRNFMSPQQLNVALQMTKGEEGAWFKAKLLELARTIRQMPETYQTDGQGGAATVHLHYFKGGSDWFIIEKDSQPDQLQTFWLADLYGDGGEVGYISIDELRAINADLDFHWTPKTLAKVRSGRRRSVTA